MPYNYAGDGRDTGGVRDRAAFAVPRSGRRAFADQFPAAGRAMMLTSGQHGSHWSSSPLSGVTSGWFGTGNTITDLTMSCWVYFFPQEVAAANFGIFGLHWGNGSAVSGLGFVTDNIANQVRFFAGTQGTAAQNAVLSGMAAGAWFHMVGTWSTVNSPQMLGYVNGIVQVNSGTRATAHVISGSTVTVGLGAVSGGTGYADGSWFPGMVRELAIWNRALTSGEALTLYNGGAQFNIAADALASGLRGWWRGGDGHGDCLEAIRDQSGNATPIHLYPQAQFREGWPRVVVAP